MKKQLFVHCNGRHYLCDLKSLKDGVRYQLGTHRELMTRYVGKVELIQTTPTTWYGFVDISFESLNTQVPVNVVISPDQNDMIIATEEPNWD